MIDKLMKELNIVLDLKDVQEIRLRRDLPIKYLKNGTYKTYKRGGVEAIASKETLEAAISVVTESSYYAFEQNFTKGFLNYHGAKISLGGRGVTEDGKFLGIRNVTSINIRLPKSVDCVSKELADDIYGKRQSVLIAGKVCSGKTTFLRALASKCPYVITVADEKGELMLDSRSLGQNADIFSFIPKELALELSVKGLSPRYIAFDEVTAFSVVDKAKAFGLSVIATTFGDDEESIKKSCCKYFDRLVILTTNEDRFEKRIVELK